MPVRDKRAYSVFSETPDQIFFHFPKSQRVVAGNIDFRADNLTALDHRAPFRAGQRAALVAFQYRSARHGGGLAGEVHFLERALVDSQRRKARFLRVGKHFRRRQSFLLRQLQERLIINGEVDGHVPLLDLMTAHIDYQRRDKPDENHETKQPIIAKLHLFSPFVLFSCRPRRSCPDGGWPSDGPARPHG